MCYRFPVPPVGSPGPALGLPFQRAAGGAAPPWSPGDAGTVLLELNSEAASALWQDTAKTIPATLAGDPIRCWAATFGVDFLQSTAGAEPALVFSGTRKFLRFDGVNDRIVRTGAPYTAGAKSWAFCWKYHALPGGTEVDSLLHLGVPSSGGLSRLLVAGASHPSAGINFNADAPGVSTQWCGVIGSAASTSLSTIVVAYNGGATTNPASYSCWINGAAQTVSARASATTPTGDSAVGASSTGGSPASIDAAHVLLWSGAISAANAVAAHSYLMGLHS